MRPHKSKRPEHREIAKERILILFTQAQKMFSSDRALAHRYVAMARKIAMKYKTKIPRFVKRQFCKHCYHYLMPGVNCRVRLGKSRVIYYCLDCKKFMRFGLKDKMRNV
ncbi:ribonuclease P [Candidatus Woesearchaeota archaeon]|nr:ribonuclease P [Candidatus Woesearchaeota archaeon]